MRKLILLLLLATPVWAEDVSDLKRFRSNASINTGMNYFGSNIGSNLSVTSPYFANESVAVRLGWVLYAQDFVIGSRSERYDFHLVEASVLFSHFILERLRGYWIIGFGVTIPDKDVSSSLSFTGTNAFGLEYFPWKEARFGLFAQLGGMGTVKGRAEEMPGEPRFGSGVQVVTGVNIYL